ncbi:SIP domain-containing protein [Euzebya sp.]|uniref:SIP domain-containing protein n=1 Tax=Euzebya sp. TaxID=1971409 RepID=UPI003510F797
MSRDVAPPVPAIEIRVTGFDQESAAVLAEVADHFNGDHADTVGLMALGAGFSPSEVHSAEIAGVDPHGLDLWVRRTDGVHGPVRLPFDAERPDVDAVRADVFGLIARTRTAVGERVPLTSIEEELASTQDLATFVTTVSAVRDLTPGMRELTVRGGLEGFAPIAPDQFLYLITAAPGGGPVTPGFTMAQLQEAPVADHPPAAYYTVRRWRPEADEMDLWVVLHGHDEGVGGWAAEVGVGDPVALWGPRSTYDPPAGTRSVLLVGDETGLPAIATILEQLDEGWTATVVVEAAAPSHAVDLPARPGVEVSWVFRDGEPAGTGTGLVDAVRGLDLDLDGLYAFGAAETRQIAAVRHHLRHERGMAADRTRMTGYWRRRG